MALRLLNLTGKIRRRTARNGESHTRTERETERTRRTRKDERTTTTEVTPVPPVPPASSATPVSPVQPVVIHDTVTNTVVKNVPVSEDVSVRVVSLDYDTATRRGVLVVEIVRGSFKKANNYIRKNFGALVRERASAPFAAKIPTDLKLEIESVSITDNDLCEVKFKTVERKD